MTSEERRAALRRLLVTGVGLVAVAGLLALLYSVLASAAATAAISAGSGIVGVGLLVSGVAAVGGTGATRKVAGSYTLRSADERRAAEGLALGLLAAGVAFSIVALVIG